MDGNIALTAKFHPLADLFPLMEGEEFDRLVQDIREHGLRFPIIQYENSILDGRNRYRACIQGGVATRFETFVGDDPLRYVMSSNLHRRHMDESQRSMVAQKVENMKRGQPQENKDANLHISRADAAKLLNVSIRQIASAKVVRDKAVPEIVSRVERGNMAVALAEKVAAMPPEIQKVVALQTEKEARGYVKKHMRAERETAQAEATQRASEAVGSQLFGVIMADPPWRFEPRSRTTGMDRSADNHYDTLTVDEVIALKGTGHVPAADDCVLFLWATVPMLLDAIDVLLGWDFEYRSHFVWVKEKIGTGYWNRNQHEILLIGTRGKVVAPAPGEQYSSVIEAKSLRHSEKPAIVAEMIEDMFPTQAKLEMFARTPRLGWTVWGNEVETTEA